MPKKTITNEGLARMIKKGFDGNDERFEKIDNKFEKVDKKFDKVDSRLENLEKGQEEIKLKLDQAAYRFEVEYLKKRVKKIEFKLGLRKA